MAERVYAACVGIINTFRSNASIFRTLNHKHVFKLIKKSYCKFIVRQFSFWLAPEKKIF